MKHESRRGCEASLAPGGAKSRRGGEASLAPGGAEPRRVATLGQHVLQG